MAYLVRHQQLLMQQRSREEVIRHQLRHRMVAAEIRCSLGEAGIAVHVETSDRRNTGAFRKRFAREEVHQVGTAGGMWLTATHGSRLMRQSRRLLENALAGRRRWSTRCPDLQAIDPQPRLESVGSAVERIGALGVVVVGVGVRLDAVVEPVDRVEITSALRDA